MERMVNMEGASLNLKLVYKTTLHEEQNANKYFKVLVGKSIQKIYRI